MKKRKSLGLGFIDEISKVRGKGTIFKEELDTDWVDSLIPHYRRKDNIKGLNNSWRVTAFADICLVVFFILFVKLFNLQITHGTLNRTLADGNRIQIRIVHAPRGVIFDKEGKVLAANA